jgi:putative NADPH-quinone reductase
LRDVVACKEQPHGQTDHHHPGPSGRTGEPFRPCACNCLCAQRRSGWTRGHGHCGGTTDFPLLRRKEDWESGALPEALRQAQQAIGWAEHLVILYPLWLGTMLALLKAFLEKVFRPGFALPQPDTDKRWQKLPTGKTARIGITMGMPALFYCWYFCAHSRKSLERNILGCCGIGPITESLIGMIEAPDNANRERWLAKMRALGRAGR